MKLGEWVQVEAAIAAAWPNARPMDDAQVRVRNGVVGDLSLEQALVEVTRLARAGREFPPTPGQLVAAAAESARPATPAVGTVIGLLEEAAGTFGARREPEALRWLAERSPHAARAAVECGWRQFCREGLYGEHGGAVRQRLERTMQSTISGLEKEITEQRVLPLVGDRIRALEAGRDQRSGLRQLGSADIGPPRRELDPGDDEPVAA